VTDKELDKNAARRLAVIRHAREVSVNGLSPAACATASFTSFLKIAASFARAAPLTCPPWSPAHSAGRTPGGSPGRSRRLTGPPARFLSLARLRVR